MAINKYKGRSFSDAASVSSVSNFEKIRNRLKYFVHLLSERSLLGGRLLLFLLLIFALQGVSAFFIFLINQEFVFLYASMDHYQKEWVYRSLSWVFVYFLSLDVMSGGMQWLTLEFERQWTSALEHSFLNDVVDVIEYLEPQSSPMHVLKELVFFLTKWCTTVLVRGGRVCMGLAILLIAHPQLCAVLLGLLLMRFILDGLATMWVPIPQPIESTVDYCLREGIEKKDTVVAAQATTAFKAEVTHAIERRTRSLGVSIFYDVFHSMLSNAVEGLSYCYLVGSQLPAYFSGRMSKNDVFLNIGSLGKLMPDLNALIKSGRIFRKVSSGLDDLSAREAHLKWIKERKNETLSSITTASNNESLVALHGIHIIATSSTRTHFQLQDWAVRPGDRVRLTGENGSGKSTLLKMLLSHVLYLPEAPMEPTPCSRYYYRDPDGGVCNREGLQILFRPSKSDPPLSHSREDAFVYPFKMTALTEEDLANKEAYFEAMGLSNPIAIPSQAPDTQNLLKGSSGEMQLWLGCGFYLQLCQAVARPQPVLLILDEACSNMDQSGEEGGKKRRYLALLLRTVRPNDAVIVVDHDSNQRYEGFIERAISSIMTKEELLPEEAGSFLGQT